MDLSECGAISPVSDDRHFWELARADFLTALVRSRLGNTAPGTILDFGCGDGYLARRMLTAMRGGWRVAGVDSELTPERAAQVESAFAPGTLQLSTELPARPAEGFRAAMLFDVLEHLEDDAAFLTRIASLLEPGGWIFLTVPADRALFGAHDVKLRHFRRYDQRDLTGLIDRCGLERVECRGLFFPLWLARRFERLLRRAPRSDVGNGALRPRALNAAFRRILNVSTAAERIFPLRGLSLEAVCRRSR